MKKLISLILVLIFLTSIGYAQAFTNDDWVTKKIEIQNLKKQIEVKEIERVDALNVIKTQYRVELQALKQQLKTAAESIGLTLDDVEN